MTTDSETTDPRVGELLDAWQAAFDAGRDTPLPEICSDCPELISQLEQQVTVLRRVGNLIVPTGPAAQTGNWDSKVPGVPERLGSYIIRGRIGRGGMGEVYRAEDPALGREVAVKVMKPALAAEPEARARFLREARTAAAIRHEHVVPIYHVGDDDGCPYIVMPLLEGESLEARLSRSAPLPLPDVVRVGCEAALGLAAIHERGLVHRDIKPGNLWLEAPEGGVRVLDFGLAKLTDRTDGLSKSGSVSGTPEYMAPEQIDGEEVGPAADLFSLGVTLYRCVTGSLAFQGKSLTAILRAVAEHNPVPPHELNEAVPAAISGIIMRLLAKAPADRPASARTVADELAKHGTTVSSLPQTTAISADTVKASRPPRQPWLLGAAVAAAAIALVWALQPGNRGELANKPPGTPPVDIKPHTVPPTPQAPLRGSVDLYVYRTDDDGSDLLVPLWDPRAMPLKPSDQVKPIATVEPPAFLYVFWIDETGTAVPAYPWRFNEWGSRPETEQAVSKAEIKWPTGDSLKITGDKAGMETVLMLARPTKLNVTDAEVQRWFTGLTPIAFKGDKAKVWFEDFDILRTDQQRAPGMGALDAADSPLAMQRILQRRIAADAGYSRGVSFSRLGKQGGKY